MSLLRLLKKDAVKERFQKYRKFLIEEAQTLTIFINLYKHLYEKRQDRLDELNKAPAFFRTVNQSLLACIINWTSNLFGKKSQRGLINFLVFVENNLNIFNYKKYPISLKTVQKHKEEIEKIQALELIRLRRDKYYAHFDKKYSFDKEVLHDESPITWKDLEDIKSIMKEIIDIYSTAYDGASYSLEFLNSYDIDRILNDLHDYKNQKDKSE